MTKTKWLSFIIVLATLILSALAFPFLPDKIASHWNADGNVNGYMGKTLGVFLVPLISIFILALFRFLPRLDPFKNNYDSFRPAYEIIVSAILVFILYIQILILAWNLGFKFDMSFAIIPAFSGMFIAIGSQLGKIKRNWFIGIRTPWTISNDLVWEKTHKVSAKFFLAAGIITLGGMSFPKKAVFLVIGSALAAAVASVIYSYFAWKKNVPENTLEKK